MVGELQGHKVDATGGLSGNNIFVEFVRNTLLLVINIMNMEWNRHRTDGRRFFK